MTKNVILFGLIGGFAVGIFAPRLFGNTDFSTANFVTGIIGAVLGLIAMGVTVHYYGRIR